MASGSKTTSCDIESPRKARRLKKDKADNNKALRKKGLDTSERSVKSAGSEGESGLFSLLRKKSATTPSADVLNASRHSKKEHGDEEEGQAGEADAEESAEEGDELEDMLDEAEHDTTCAICLNDYGEFFFDTIDESQRQTLFLSLCTLSLSFTHTHELTHYEFVLSFIFCTEEGELVLTGQNCNHMFRRSCALEWLEKHDHCPYCREEMVTPQSMKSMALTVLGAQRVQQMTMWTNNAGVEVPTVTTAAAATATTNDTAATTTTTTTTTITITTTTPGQAARTTTAHDVVITSSSLPATASNNADGAAAEEDEEPQQPTTTATTGDEEEKETVDETDKVNKDAPKAFELQGQEEESTAVEEENEPDRISESIKEEETKKKETQDGKVQD